MRLPAWMLLLTAMILTGCAGSARRPPATAPSSATRSAEVARPPGVIHADYEALWNACEAAAKARLFPIQRTDYRAGVLTTEPVVSKQAFEIWRNDVVAASDVIESSLATIRRTIRFEIEPTDDGRFRAIPSVLVERYSAAERRITSTAFYRSLFRRNAVRARGTRESDRGIILPGHYWYELGYDAALERELRQAIRSRVKQRD